jgi:hypothetical protein
MPLLLLSAIALAFQESRSLSSLGMTSDLRFAISFEIVCEQHAAFL